MENAKRHFAISELAKEFDVSKRHIRFCEEKGLISPKVTKLSRRIYSSYDRARLKLIFHCVLIGYSQDQIVELIGMPDAALDEADQIKKGLAYAEKMIEELEKRRKELSFHQRTSVINEIKMLGEYIKEIKTIPLETLEKSAATPHIPDKESKDKAHKAVEEIKPGVEQKPGRQPARMVPLYIAGVVIVLIIGGFFYYQGSKKDSESIYLVQKEPAKTETQPVYRDRVPIDKIGKQEDLKPMSPESAAAEKAAAEKAAAEKAAAERAAAEKAAAEKAAAQKAAAEKAAAEKAAAEKAAAEKAAAEKAAAEKAAAERAAAEKAAAERAAAERAVAEKAASIAMGTPLTVKSAVEKPEAAIVEAKQAEINKDAQSEAVAKVAPDLPGAFPEPEKQESVSVPNLQASEAEIKEGNTIEESDIKEPLFTAKTDTSLPQELKTERPGAVEESPPSIEQEEDKETLASGGEILSEQDRKNRLESFLNIYCQTYASKDLDKFATFFTPDATENNTPFQDMLPNYRKNLEMIQSFNYRIELIAYSLQTNTGNIKIQGKYFTRFLLHEGTWRENSGNISMELVENGDSYLVKRLIYGQ
jgi:DNA-binding transcriptional MerR regulator